MNKKDEDYIEYLIKYSGKYSLKKRRIIRNITAVVLLMLFPIAGYWGSKKLIIKNQINPQELMTNEFFIIGFLGALFILTPMIFLVFHIWNPEEYDDLKKNELIIDLYQKLKNKL